MKFIKPNVLSAMIAGTLFFSASASAAVYVVNNGTELQAALDTAVSDNAPVIVINGSIDTSITTDGLVYTGIHPLTIVGSGQTILGNPDNVILDVANGADLSISNLNFTVEDQGFSVTNQGGNKGIFVKVPVERTGIVNLALTNVMVSNVGGHGVHVSDCDLEGCGAGGGGSGNGSAASVSVKLVDVSVDHVGFGHFDADGVRVDERDAGDIIFSAVNSVFTNVGADGVELDEGQDGDVIVNVHNAGFETNGAFCDGVNIGSPVDPLCVEDGELDLDDGFDIDEAGNGSITGQLKNALVANNFDEGLDFDEEGDGGVNIKLARIEAHHNGDEGIKVSEEDAGDVVVAMKALTITENGDDGMQIEQENAGVITVEVNATTSFNNAKKGLKVSTDNGEGSLKVRGSNIESISSDVDEI